VTREGGSEWEPIKILLQRENSAYAPNSQPRIPTRVYQGHVVTTDLLTLGTNPKQSQSGSTTQEVKDLAVVRKPRRTVREHRVDGPRPSSGQSVKCNRITKHASRNADGLYPTRGLSESNLCHVDSLRPPGGRSAKPHATKLSHLERSTHELARIGRTREELTPRGWSASYRRTVRQPSIRTTRGENREVNLPYPTMDLPNGLSS
jgi:hypothetical protein